MRIVQVVKLVEVEDEVARIISFLFTSVFWLGKRQSGDARPGR